VGGMQNNAPSRGGRHGSASTQHDARDEYEGKENLRPAFVHAQTYKLNAGRVVEKWREEINGRIFGSEKEMRERFFGRDLEEEVWREVKWTGCQLERSFRDWEGRVGVCRNVTEVCEELFGGKA